MTTTIGCLETEDDYDTDEHPADICEWVQPGRHGSETCGEYKDEQADDRLPYCTRHVVLAMNDEER
jgi:hypothetical protein